MAERKIIRLMENWTFTGPEGTKQQVNLPHTWNARDGQDGGDDYFRGTCVYEKEIPKPEFQKGERVYLQFHGVNASAHVLLNGKKVCSHHNGYSTFRADVTKKLKDNNLLRVEVDNSKNERVYPQVADFTFYGGIYREVEFLIVSENHFELDYYGGPGIKISTDVKGTDGFVTVQTYVAAPQPGNGSDEKDNLTVELTLKDAEGTVVAQSKGTKAVFKVEQPHLWNGVKDPYLYRVTASLKRGEELLDQITSACGIRTFSVDPKRGFFLNGVSYPLRGVSRHQDWKGIGNAISREQMEQDMELIREVGANTIRLAHYQHSQYFYDLCDRYGMVVWAEIPYISAHMPGGKKNTFFQMKELITQNYNHPSIVTWGLSNEITISGKHRRDMLNHHRKLQNYVKRLDPGRPTTLACYAMCHPFHPVSKISDLVAWNLYLGWYVPGLFLNDLFLKFYHWKYPNRCLGYSEYGAEGMPNLHSGKPKRGDQTEEYQAKYHEYMLNCFARHPFLWSTYVWNMFDFAADARDQGGEPGMNHKGLVTFDRKIKKDSFYIYKAWWSEEPFVHLCGKRYEYRTEEITDVTVYSNQQEVSLYQNGKKIDVKKGRHAFHFQVKLEQENHLEARSGDLKDEAVIYRTDTPRPEYKVKKSKSKNWV
ncbi:MAG: glycoside hydrolase family 2 protein [Lachnospiraceae bacterium]|nr:glycoside hydrolase family 2 protein [Lachnospiraceae bacterium]